MSGPHHTLSKRILPPMLPSQKAGPTARAVPQQLDRGDTVTVTAVKAFLRNNPDFLRQYLLDSLSSSQLLAIANAKLSLETSPASLEIERESPSRDSPLSPITDHSPTHAFEATLSSSLMMKNKFLDKRPNTSIRRALLDRSKLLSELTKGINRQPNKARILAELKDCIAAAVNADGASLYLVDESGDFIYYYNPHFDNDVTNSPCTRRISESTTLAAYVAQRKKPERIADIDTDPRFTQALPVGGDLVQSVMAQPIFQDYEQVAGVVEFYRTAGKPPFLLEDEEIVTTYLVWGGVAVTCSEMYHRNIRQQRLNQFILDVAQSMFGKFKSMESVIKDIMRYAKDLVKADRASLFLVDRDAQEIYSRIFDVGSHRDNEFLTKENVIRFPMDKGVAGYVATTGQTVCISDAYSDPRFNREIDQQTGYTTKTILCMPVKLQAEVIGVVQMLNKLSGHFTKEDEIHFQTFATYCGLALHIAKMYEKIRRSEQKHKVALEVLSYHSQYNDEEFRMLQGSPIPAKIDHIAEYTFSPWSVGETQKPIHVIYMFRDLFGLQNSNSGSSVGKFEEETLLKFTLTVRKNYRRVPYHNWAHAFSVAHSMYTVLKTTSHQFSAEECLALYVASLCHDLDHRGKTNQFMVKSASPLAAIYSTSTMEHHHFNMTVAILQREGHNIFKHLNSGYYKKVLGNIKHCILATDLAKFFDYKARLEHSLGEQGFSWTQEEQRLTLMAVSMTACDLCSMFKPWKIQLPLVMVIMEEFWIQGDEEKCQGEKPIRMMDRDYKHELPESQVGFIKGICIPCYYLLSRVLPEARAMVDGATKNLTQWETLAALDPKMKESKMLELTRSITPASGGSGHTKLNMT